MEAAPMPNSQKNLRSPDYDVNVNKHGVWAPTFYIRMLQHRFWRCDERAFVCYRKNPGMLSSDCRGYPEKDHADPIVDTLQ